MVQIEHRLHDAATTGMAVTASLKRRGRAWVAVIASYVVLFTAIFGSLAPSPDGPRVAGPAFVLCAHDAPGHPPDPAPGPHRHEDGCCLAGCCMGGATVVVAMAALPAPPERFVALPAPVPDGAGGDRRPSASPRQTRGPPSLV